MARSRASLGAEIVAGTGIVAAVLLTLRAGAGHLPGEAWLAPVVFLYLPVIAAVIGDRDFKAIGLAAPSWSRAARDLALSILVVIPIFLVSWWALYRFGKGVRFQPEWPPDFWSDALWQLLGVALPEEVLFRGWLQGRLNQVFKMRRRILRAQVGPGLFLAAALFALAHFVVVPRPHQLMVFFPGLLFGWLRERSGSAAAPIIAHAVSNVSFLILQGWAAR